MLDLARTFLDIPLWLWMIGILAIILVFVVIARTMKFQGVNLSLTPPFFTFRFDRETVREQTRQVSENPTGLSAPIGVNVVDGTASAQRDIVGGNVTNIGEQHQHISPALSERVSTGSAPPPARTAHYVSRGKIQADVCAALESRTAVAVVGVAGMGGIGKTELAKHLCGELERARHHRVIWIGVYNRLLADLQSELARALGVTFPPNATDQSRYEMLLAAFHDNPRIVFFDDVYKSAIPALKFLLPPSPPCAALITSRQRELGGVARVFELDVMTLDQALELMGEAHGLQDALAREPDATRELCRLCGYLPLALDIAASRLRKQLHFSTTPIAAFNRALANRLKELQRGNKPDRLDSVTANIALSYDDLDDADRHRLRSLAVFAPSGFAPLAAAALWGESEADARASIERLQDGSLVMDAEAVGRFRLHDLVRDYAVMKLNESGESDTANRAHAEFLIALFDEEYTNVSPESPAALELENLILAANWAHEKHEAQLLALLATKPRNWWYVLWTDSWDEWMVWLNDALRIGKDYKPDLRANVLQAIGDVQQFRKENDAALKSYEQALALFRSVGDRLGEANVLKAIGDVQQFRDERDAALKSYEQALALFRSVGARLGEANVLAALCRLDLQAGDSAKAEQSLEQVILVRREIGDLYSEGADLGNFAVALLQLGEKTKAKMYALKAKSVFERIGEASVIEQVNRLIAACDE